MLNKLFRKTKRLTSDKEKGLFSPLRQVSKNEVEGKLFKAWQDPDIPKRQFELFVKKQLKDYRQGRPVGVFDALVDILKDNINNFEKSRLLEIGCSSGYYSEALKTKGVNAEYHGCDYSDAFVRFAQELYPGIDFQVQDACSLSYPDESFDIVLSGCCLLHILDYEKAIEETARVAKEYVVLHRTPVLHKSATSFYVKKAYGVEMFEIHFNEREMLRLMKKNNLKLVDIITLDAGLEEATGDIQAQKTYLCKKG